MMRKYKMLFLLPVILLVLAGCGSDDGEADTDDPVSPDVTTEEAPVPAADSQNSTNEENNTEQMEPVEDVQDMTALQTYYMAIQTAQEDIAWIWTRIRNNEQVSCTEYPGIEPVPSETIEGDSRLAMQLRLAADATEESVQIWRAQCSNPGSQIPPDISELGLNAALAAGDALREFERLSGN